LSESKRPITFPNDDHRCVLDFGAIHPLTQIASLVFGVTSIGRLAPESLATSISAEGIDTRSVSGRFIHDAKHAGPATI
jgi:hypothetical protein